MKIKKGACPGLSEYFWNAWSEAEIVSVNTQGKYFSRHLGWLFLPTKGWLSATCRQLNT
jgi:hypothetical protein